MKEINQEEESIRWNRKKKKKLKKEIMLEKNLKKEK